MSMVTIRHEDLEATIDSMGAQLMSLKLDGGEYLWQGDKRWWSRRAPVLFPIVGCLRNDFATSAQGDVRLKRHGIARLYDHEVASASEDAVTFRFASSDETRASFPYDFELDMTYALSDRGLTQTFVVTNTGSVTLPFTLGGHPAFNIPAPGSNEAFDEYEFRFARPWTAYTPAIDDAGIADFGTTTLVVDDADVLPLSHELIAHLLTITLLDVPDRTITLVGPHSGHGVTLDFAGFDYLGIWTAALDAPFVAIEPWRGCATARDESDVFEDKRGTTILQPNETGRYSFDIRPF
jgi:Galactose mutarotase and related enzymes